MLKSLLYIFAVIGLLASPLAASAAGADCGAMSMKASPTAHASMDKMDCCDHAKSSKHADKTCEQNCIAMCGVMAALGDKPVMLSQYLSVKNIAFAQRTTQLLSQEPSFTDPPPKLIA